MVFRRAVAGRVLKLLQCGTSDGGIVYLCTWDIPISCTCGHSRIFIVWYLCVCVVRWYLGEQSNTFLLPPCVTSKPSLSKPNVDLENFCYKVKVTLICVAPSGVRGSILVQLQCITIMQPTYIICIYKLQTLMQF